MTLVGILLLAVGTYAMKAVGPVLWAGRQLPVGLRQVANLLPAALLAALVASQTFSTGTSLIVDARVVGLGLAGVAVALKAPFAAVVLVGAAGAAVTRMLV